MFAFIWWFASPSHSLNLNSLSQSHGLTCSIIIIFTTYYSGFILSLSSFLSLPLITFTFSSHLSNLSLSTRKFSIFLFLLYILCLSAHPCWDLGGHNFIQMVFKLYIKGNFVKTMIYKIIMHEHNINIHANMHNRNIMIPCRKTHPF